MKKIMPVVVSALVICIVVVLVLIGLAKRERGSGTRSISSLRAGSPAFFLKEAEEALAANDLLRARTLYKKAKERTERVEQLREVQEKIEAINMKILFSPLVDDCSTTYVVKPNDALIKIARKFNTTVAFIKRANGLSSHIIRPGQELKVNTCKFSIAVDKSQRLLFLKQGDEVINTYEVAIGKDNGTPAGNFKIKNKLINPTWFKAGAVIPPESPENILGSRWLGFDLKGYGIHGTNDPSTIGREVTLGCVRMKNRDVEEVYSIVPVGTEVTVVE